MNGCLILARMLEGLAGWMQDELAGGASPEWVAQVAVLAILYIAEIATLEANGI